MLAQARLSFRWGGGGQVALNRSPEFRMKLTTLLGDIFLKNIILKLFMYSRRLSKKKKNNSVHRLCGTGFSRFLLLYVI